MRRVLVEQVATQREEHETNTDHERSVFIKLSLGLIANTVLIPIAAGGYNALHVSGKTSNQGWYEDSGVVMSAVFLVFGAAFGSDCVKLVGHGMRAPGRPE